MRVDGNSGATKGYSPNSIGEWKTTPAMYTHSAVAGESMRYNPYEDRTDDCFYQPGNLYRLMSEEKRALLISNTAEDMMPVTDNIKYRHAAHCYLADKEYGTRLAKALGLDVSKVESLVALSEDERLKETSACNK
jgi:catalase